MVALQQTIMPHAYTKCPPAKPANQPANLRGRTPFSSPEPFVSWSLVGYKLSRVALGTRIGRTHAQRITSSIKIKSNIVYQAKLLATILLWCSSVRVNFGGFTPEPGGGGSQEKNEVKVVPEKLCWETSCQKNRDK